MISILLSSINTERIQQIVSKCFKFQFYLVLLIHGVNKGKVAPVTDFNST